ncbi:hypothetical protein EC991_008128 [Linnemannia zychae]|nr:hypothetical protein EC991_008128 [Linnemannia zychae]
MDSRTSYNPVRPLIIALCVILILSIILSCIRRKRFLALQQQQLAQQGQTAELGDVAYIYQYPPPAGTPSTPYQQQPMYAPPPGAPGTPMMSQPMAGSYYAPPGGDQPQPFPQAHFAYPPMPVPAATNGGATSSTTTTTTTYVAPQDGSANLTNADIAEGVSAAPPPPYTATVPK